MPWWLVLLAAAVGAPLLSPFAPNAQDILHRLRGPAAPHWLGTDNFGRDTLSRILWGLPHRVRRGSRVRWAPALSGGRRHRAGGSLVGRLDR